MSVSNQIENDRSDTVLFIDPKHSSGGVAMIQLLGVLALIVGGVATFFFGQGPLEALRTQIGMAMFLIGILAALSMRGRRGNEVSMRSFSERIVADQTHS